MLLEMLLVFVICAVVAAILVSFLRQRIDREKFNAKVFAQRTAGGVGVVLAFVTIFALAGFAMFVFSMLLLGLGLSEMGCSNC
jgi:hypothetical protein